MIAFCALLARRLIQIKRKRTSATRDAGSLGTVSNQRRFDIQSRDQFRNCLTLNTLILIELNFLTIVPRQRGKSEKRVFTVKVSALIIFHYLNK